MTTKLNPSKELIATHPLAAGHVHVHEVPENPGYYRVGLEVVPHFQVEGLDITLSLMAQLPSGQ